MNRKQHFCLFIILFTYCVVGYAQNSWPKDINFSNGGKVTIYQPQSESFEGTKLTGRSAVSVRKTASAEPVFGAIFFAATLLTDKISRMALLESVVITNAKFSGVEDQKEIDNLTSLIQKEAPKWQLKVSIDELVASIKKENISQVSSGFQNDPPKIIYASMPTTLVVLDGEPQIQKDVDLDADKVVNSPNLIFKEGSQWNLRAGGIWYKSTGVIDGWKQNNSLSKKVKSVNEQVKKQEKENNEGKTITEKPVVTAIMVVTEPTELIQSKGEANYKTIAGTSLLYVFNSPNEIFKEINIQKTFVLLAGRWYAAPNINGPWNYIEADKLPEDFAKIPEESDKGEVLANVAGTEEAEEARIDAEIPQTAKVNRKTATVKVEYDGTPQFNKIEGTSLQLAENANLTVMIDPGGRYFALDNGVWFLSNTANGPWIVANERPKDVDIIPASSPAYNTKYVYIYNQTPDYVYTGYTSGYTGGYIYGHTIVYGTGYRYRPWFRKRYFPRAVTWGYGFQYNAWYGWSMNWGFNFGFLYIGFTGSRYGWGGGWFGPPMYRPPYRPTYWNSGYHGNNRPRPSYGGGNHGGSRPGSGWSNNNNIYNHHKGVITKNIDRTKITRPAFGNKLDANYKRPSVEKNNKLPLSKLPIDNKNKLPIDNKNKLPVNKKPDNKLPVIDNNKKPDNDKNSLPIKTKENKIGTPIYKDNNVLADAEGNVFKKDLKDNNWQIRDNKTKDWKPLTEDKKAQLPDLNKQERTRERSETRQTNFARDVPTIIRQMSTKPTKPATTDNKPSVQKTLPNKFGNRRG